ITDGAKKAAGGAKKVAGAAVRGSAASVVGFWRGFTYPFRGMKLVFFQHPGLVRFWIVPILITVLLLGGIGAGGLSAYRGLTNLMWTESAEVGSADIKTFEGRDADKPKVPRTEDKRLDEDESFWTGPAHYTHVALEFLVLALLWGLGLLVVVFLTNVIAAPFNDFLSEEVERIKTGSEGPKFSLKVILRDTVRTVGLEVIKIGIYLMVMVPLWLLSLLLPVFGQILYSVFGFFFTAMYFAVDYIDWPASRRNRSITYRFGMLTEHALPMLGFGTGVWMFLFIPIVNLLFMPACVAGGTLLFLDLEGESAGKTDALGS
ncbi:MAG: EI24 domain-containing protein, partial [Sandaracinaceae bacterium]